MLARAVLKMSKKSWYSFGMQVMSIGALLVYVLLDAERSSWKVCVPSILEIWANTAALTRAIMGATSGVGVGGSDEHGTDVAGLGDTIDSAGVGEPNMILLKAQSINGL